MSSAANETITRHLQELDRRLKKIQHIHIKKNTTISGLKAAQISVTENTKLDSLEVELKEVYANLTKEQQKHGGLVLKLIEVEKELAEQKRKSSFLVHDLDIQGGKIKESETNIETETKRGTTLLESLHVKREKAKLSPPNTTPVPTPALAQGDAGAAAAAATPPPAQGGAKPVVATATNNEAAKGGGGYLSGLGASIQGSLNAINPFGTKKSEVQAAAVVELPEKQPVPELTDAETLAPEAMKTAIEEADKAAEETARKAAEATARAKEDARALETARAEEDARALETARVAEEKMQKEAVDKAETARLKEVEKQKEEAEVERKAAEATARAEEDARALETARVEEAAAAKKKEEEEAAAKKKEEEALETARLAAADTARLAAEAGAAVTGVVGGEDKEAETEESLKKDLEKMKTMDFKELKALAQELRTPNRAAATNFISDLTAYYQEKLNNIGKSSDLGSGVGRQEAAPVDNNAAAASLVEVETTPLVAAGGTPENTGMNLDFLQLNDAELKDVCTQKGISVAGNVGSSGKIKLILENGDGKDAEYTAQKYKVTETDRTKRTQQLLKLRFTIAAMTTWNTLAFNAFSEKHNLGLQKDSKTLPEVANVLKSKTPIERSIIMEDMLLNLGFVSKKAQVAQASKYCIDGVGAEPAKTVLKNVKTLLEVPLTQYNIAGWGPV
jgi:hypothetical protein